MADFHLFVSGFESSEAKSLDCGQDFIGGFCPIEGPGVFVGGVDVFDDRLLQFLGRAVDAPAQLFFGQQRKKPFDLVQPGSAGRREMDMPVRPFGEPVADRLGLMGGVIVHDDVNVETRPGRTVLRIYE